MPIEWNILMIYGGFFLFGFHPEASVSRRSLRAPWLAAFLFFCLVVVPAYGNFVPSRVSFLLAMRYYAGNWAYNIWLVRKGSAAKLEKLVKAAGTMREQLEKLLGRPDRGRRGDRRSRWRTASCTSRAGRCSRRCRRRSTTSTHYEWMDGEVVGGMVLGWNFGDGHLNGHAAPATPSRRSAASSRARCACVMVESQPLFGRTMEWKIVDAASGVVAEGETELARDARGAAVADGSRTPRRSCGGRATA